jgi:hypothetical protein
MPHLQGLQNLRPIDKSQPNKSGGLLPTSRVEIQACIGGLPRPLQWHLKFLIILHTEVIPWLGKYKQIYHYLWVTLALFFLKFSLILLNNVFKVKTYFETNAKFFIKTVYQKCCSRVLKLVPSLQKKIVFSHLHFATCTVTVHVANSWPCTSGHVKTRGESE